MKLAGSCHCGATKFQVTAAPETVTRCTCSLCAKRGARWAYYDPADFELLTPREDMSSYRWNSRIVSHNFCPVCGCGTFSDIYDFSNGTPDFDRPRVAVNAHLLDDFDLDTVPVVVIDGKNLW